MMIYPEKQGNGVATDARAVHSSMHRSLEDVVFRILNLLIVSEIEDRGLLDIRANSSPML